MQASNVLREHQYSQKTQRRMETVTFALSPQIYSTTFENPMSNSIPWWQAMKCFRTRAWCLWKIIRWISCNVNFVYVSQLLSIVGHHTDVNVHLGVKVWALLPPTLHRPPDLQQLLVVTTSLTGICHLLLGTSAYLLPITHGLIVQANVFGPFRSITLTGF